MFDDLDQAIRAKDPDALQRAIFTLGQLRDENGMVPDEVSFRIIDALRQPQMAASPLAAHLLNHFEFHSPCLSFKAKDRCVGFLEAWGDSLSHFHAQQVVAELRKGDYLAEVAPNKSFKPNPLRGSA